MKNNITSKFIYPTLLVLAAQCYKAQSPNWFPYSATITAGRSPLTLAVADFNGDGKPDLAAGNYASNSISVFLNNSNGNALLPPVQYSTSAAPVTSSPKIIAADFNNDGRKDIAAAVSGSTSVTLEVFLGTGNGSFAPPLTFSTCSTPTVSGTSNAIDAADYNNDGNIDIAIGGSYIHTFYGNGSGGFTCNSLNLSSFSRSLISADFNGDGFRELALIVGGMNISVFSGGTAPFSSFVNTPVTAFPNFISAADFNGDNKPDILLTNLGLSTARIYIGDGLGTLSLSATYTVQYASYSHARDLNGDNKIDLAITSGDKIVVLQGVGDGSFIPAGSYPVNSTAASISSADMNGDNKPDLIIGSGIENNNLAIDTINILFNQSMPVIPTGISSKPGNRPAPVVYPNPGTGKYLITTYSAPGECQDIEVLNCLGQVVYEQTLCSDAAHELNLADRPNGIYTVKISYPGSASSCCRIIKE